MSTLWELSCEVESLACRISNVANMVEVLATAESQEPTSGALWAVRDYLEILEEKLMNQSETIMDLHRAERIKAEPKPKKKKKEIDMDGRC